MHNNYFDPILFFEALSLPEYYPYIGDLQSNLFYVSDEMRDVFGLPSNIVHDLVSVWGSRITDPKDAEIFREDIAQILRGEKAFMICIIESGTRRAMMYGFTVTVWSNGIRIGQSPCFSPAESLARRKILQLTA